MKDILPEGTALSHGLSTERNDIINKIRSKAGRMNISSATKFDSANKEKILVDQTSFSRPVINVDLKAIGDRVKTGLQRQEEEFETIWKPILDSDTHKKLKNIYHEISPEGVVFFDVLDQEKFVSQTEANFERLMEEHHVDTIKRWNDTEIERMFGKGLNPTSLITSYESAEWFAKETRLTDNPIILELGTGAGWATVMLFETVKKEYPNAKVKQFSVDMSPHAIAATQTLLTYKNIPHIIAANLDELQQIQAWINETEDGRNFSGIILVLDYINEGLDSFSEKSVEGVYSSHGTAYLSKNEYIDFMKLLPIKMKKNGVFIADSLNPIYTNQLDIFITLLQMIAPKKMQEYYNKKGVVYIYGEKIRNNSKYFPGEDVQILKGFNIPHAYLIFKWCNYLMRKLDLKRLMKTVKSLQVTMKVVDEYRSDVFPSYLLKDIVTEEKLNFEVLGNKPDFPVFMDTEGFRILA